MANKIRSNLKKIGFAVLLLVLAYLPIFIWMWDRWFVRDSYYSHGILVPLVSGYLIWQVKDELRRCRYVASPWAMRFIVLGIIIHLISSVLRIYFTSGFSLIIVLIGLVLHFFGSAVLKKVIFPVLFLVFMVPLPLVIITNLSFRLKVFAAEISAIFLNNIGLPAVQDGSIIKMRHTYVIVDDVCSGLRSLVSLTALGSVFAYWMKSAMFKRVLLFLSTIPIAIVTNVCRIILLSMVSEIWGSKYATGFFHDLTGYMVFVLAFIMLYAVGKIIE